MKPVSIDIEEYLQSSVAIDRHHPAIIQLADAITVDLDGDVAKAKGLSEIAGKPCPSRAEM